MLYLYDKTIHEKGKLKLVFKTSYSEKQFFEFGFEKTFGIEETPNHIVEKKLFKYPILENEIIREMTNDELKIKGFLKLEEGEKIENGKILTIKKENENSFWNGIEWVIDTEKEKEKTVKKIESLEIELANKKLLIAYRSEIGLTTIEQETEYNELLKKHSDECQYLSSLRIEV